MHADNSAHLAAAARRRSEQTLARARTALAELVEDDRPVTIAAVAAQAGVSRAWLYNHPKLRQQILARPGRAQPRTRPAATGTPASDASLRQRLSLALERARQLSEENTQLRNQIAHLHGELRTAKLTHTDHIMDIVHDTTRQVTGHTGQDHLR